MDLEKSLIKIALYISCNDGVLSETEEIQLIELASKNFPNLDKQLIEAWIDEFFEEDLQLEAYCECIQALDDRLSALQIAVVTASADGLDIKENLALCKVMNYWDVSWAEITNG